MVHVHKNGIDKFTYGGWSNDGDPLLAGCLDELLSMVLRNTLGYDRYRVELCVCGWVWGIDIAQIKLPSTKSVQEFANPELLRI